MSPESSTNSTGSASIFRGLRSAARTAYLLVVQCAVGLVWLAVSLHLLLNSPSAAKQLSQLVSDALPGTLVLGGMRLGWTLDDAQLGMRAAVRDLRVTDPDGQEVMAARTLRARVSLWPLLTGLRNDHLRLSIPELLVDRPAMRLRNDARGRLTLNLAFADPDEPPPPEPPKPFSLTIGAAELREGRFDMDLPGTALFASGLWLKSQGIVVQTRPGQPPDIRYELRDAVAARVATRVDSMQLLPPIPDSSVQIARIDGELNSVRLTAVSAQMPPLQLRDGLRQLPATVLANADITSAWGARSTTRGEHMLVRTSSDDPHVRELLGRGYGAHAAMTASFSVDPDQGFVLQGDVMCGGLVAGFWSQRIAGNVRVETGAPGAAPVRVISTGVQVHAYGGKMSSPRIDYWMPVGRNEHWVRGLIRVDGMRADAPLVAEGVGLPAGDLTPLLAAGSLTGDLGVVSRTLLYPDRPVDYDVALDAELELRRDAFVKLLQQKLPAVRMVGGMRTNFDSERGLRIGMSDLKLTADGDDGERLIRMRADGLFDLAGKGTRLALQLDIPRLQDWLGPFGVPNLSGALRFDSGDLTGDWHDPTLLGHLALDNLAMPGLQARHVRSRLRMNQGVLYLDDLAVETTFGTAKADVEIGVFGRDIGMLRSSFPTKVRNANVQRIELGRLVPGVTGTGEIRNGQFTLDAKNWASTMAGSAALTLRDVRTGGELLDRVQGDVRFGGGDCSLANGRVQMHGADVSDDIEVSGQYDLVGQTFATEFKVPLLPFSRLRALASMPLHGKVALAGRLFGSLRDFEGEVGVQLRGLGWDKIKLGDGDFLLTKRRGGVATLTAQDNLDHFDVQPGSEIAFAGLSKLTTMALRVRTHGEIDPFAVAGLPKPPALSARLEGEIATLVDLRPGATLYAVDTAIAAGHLQVEFTGGHKLRNTSPAQIRLTPDKIAIGDTHFSLHRSEFEVCGDLTLPKDGEAMAMAMFVAGSLDIPRSGAWAESLSDLDLRLDILPDPVVAADPASNCLAAAPSARGRLRLAGPVNAPRVQGTLQTRAGKVALRKYPHEIAIDEGGRLQIASVGSGGGLSGLQLTIPQANKLAMRIDNGTLKIDGRMSLKNLQIDSMDLMFAGDELPVDVPKQYSMRVSPAVRLTARNYSDAERRDWWAKGRVVVSEGIYYRNFDTLSGVVGNASGRTVDSYSKPLTETWPELADLQLDLGVLGGNFEVSSRFPLVKADLVTEFGVQVKGTLPAMRVYDHAKVVPGSGSQVSYAFNNLVFDVDRGDLDFTGNWMRPYLDVSLRTDVAVRASTRSGGLTGAFGAELSTDSAAADEVVQVYVQIAGVWSENSKDFKIRLSSNKGDTEKDVQCLILFRRRCGDAGGSAPRLTTDMLFGEAINSLATSLLKTFVDTIAIDFDPANVGVTAEASKKFGKSMALGARMQTGRETRYTANFAFKITDRLSLNGLFRRERPVDASGTQEAPVTVYESKLRYKVPLDD